jgi:cobalt-zinc-cadmium efflux system outer membrane protein
MKRFFPSLSATAVAALLLLAPGLSLAQQSPALTWEQTKAKFEAANPALRADALGVDEMKAAEITAFLRPNPTVGLSSDGLQITPHSAPGQGTHWQPLTGTQLVPGFSYLHERERKRELRLQSAKEGTQIAGAQHEDLERNLLFDLRTAFVDALQAKAVLELAQADLASAPCPSRPIPTSPIITSRSSPSGPAEAPKRSSVRSLSPSKIRWPASLTSPTCAPRRWPAFPA